VEFQRAKNTVKKGLSGLSQEGEWKKDWGKKTPKNSPGAKQSKCQKAGTEKMQQKPTTHGLDKKTSEEKQ